MDDLINRLSEIRSRYNCFDESEEPYYRALSEAIKFLSGQADGDTISRKAAIDALERKKDKNAKGDIGGFYNKIIQNDIDALMRLPSAQPEQRWIPMSEKMPEGGHNIIFCDSKGNVCEGVYHAIIGQWVGFRWDAIYHHDDVTAWMPLPDPYKEEE